MRVCPMCKDDTNQTMRIVRGAAWRGAQPTRRRVRALHAAVRREICIQRTCVKQGQRLCCIRCAWCGRGWASTSAAFMRLSTAPECVELCRFFPLRAFMAPPYPALPCPHRARAPHVASPSASMVQSLVWCTTSQGPWFAGRDCP